VTINTTPHTPAALQDADGLAVIGRTLHDLRGIRFDGDEGGNAPAGQQPAAGQPTPGQQPAGQPSHQRSTSPFPGPAPRGEQPPAAPPAPTGDPVPGGAPTETPAPTNPAPAPATPGQYTPEQTQQYNRQLRDEAKANRERAEAAEAARNDSLKALGLQLDAEGNIVPIPKDAPPAEAVAAQTERDNTARENLVLRVSPSLAADADKMLDSRAFAQKLSELEPDDRAGAEALVRDWVKDHPEHGLAPLPAASSGATAHAGGAPVNGRKPREEALKARYAGKQRA
jgi:hypothetical protein